MMSEWAVIPTMHSGLEKDTMMTTPQFLPLRFHRRNGFTLLESLMASGILLIVVVAVTQAVTAGQANAYEAHQRIAATLAAQELMGRVVSHDPYSTLLTTWNGSAETVGAMTDFNSAPLSDTYNMVGRRVIVTTTQKTIPGLNIVIDGLTIVVEGFNASGDILASLEHFIPQPASESLGAGGGGGGVLDVGGGGKFIVK